jgi:multidrug resistance efflux pump
MKFELLSDNIEQTIGKPLASFSKIYRHNKNSAIKKIFWYLIPLCLVILFLPWTQNIRSEGDVTTRLQEERPQQVNSIIPGRIVKWYVNEGDFVKKGDTILKLAEIKDDYLDPNLLQQTNAQLTSESNSIGFYKNKITSYEHQINALENDRLIKLKSIDNKLIQTQRKIVGDSMKLIAAKNELTIAERQLDAANKMYQQGAIPLTEYEKRKASFQNTNSKWVGTINDFNNNKQELLILQLDKNAAIQGYAEKIAKAESEIFQSQSQISSTEGKVAKLQNQYDNYRIRTGQYFVIAPQNGQIIKARKSGINEMVKDGEMVVEIVPDKFQKAVEIWVEPMDLQLLNIGQEVRIMFDGFPSIVFSGWPSQSYGTFSGEVSAIESNVGVNGKFRVLVIENEKYKPWPKEVKLGCGVKSFALLKNVSVWYELWRQVNGFPPDFYKKETTTTKK